jgi:tRNA dimethylallyltransferase
VRATARGAAWTCARGSGPRYENVWSVARKAQDRRPGVYRGFDIGTGKPTAQERARARHHLVDVADATDPWDAARWAAEAERVIEDVRGRGKVPVICGGTYLWVRALVFELTGRRLSDLQREHRASPARHRARLVGLRRSGAVLDQRIVARAAQWIRGGWVEEVRGLVARGMRDTRPMSSVGYRQALDYIEGRMAESELVGAITRATRVFARRQRTWLRDEPVVWVDPG